MFYYYVKHDLLPLGHIRIELDMSRDSVTRPVMRRSVVVNLLSLPGYNVVIWILITLQRVVRGQNLVVSATDIVNLD